MSSQKGDTASSKEVKWSSLKSFLAKLRKRHIIETLAAFIGGGWLIYEIVERVLVLHYKFPEALLDITLVTLIAAMLCTILWRWFSGTEKRPGNVKVEVLIVPLVILVTLAIDLDLIFQLAGISGKKLLIGIIALCLGIVWVFIKLYQWAARTPDVAVWKFDISKLAEIKPEKSIVVLPFADLSPQKDQEYFCDGMTEEIITDLSHIHELRVISRNSAMMLKGTPKDTGTIGRELKVQYVLEGSVRKAGNDLRITAQLIDSSTDAHLWADKFSGTLDDVFAMQEKISRKIVDALKMKLSQEEEGMIADRPIENVHAYECYFRAKKEFWSWSEDGLGRALNEIQRGLKIIGQNELLYSTEGSLYLRYAFLVVDKEKYIEKMEECVNSIFELNPNSHYGHFLSGLVQYQRRNIQKAVNHLKQAIAMDPQNPDVLFWLVYFYATAGKNSVAKPLAKKLIEIDPLTPLNHLMPGWLAELEGRFDISLEYKRKCYEMEPENPWYRWIYAWILLYNKRFDEAFQIIDLIVEETPHSLYAWQGLFHKYAVTGEKEKAMSLITAEREKISIDETAFGMAECYALINEKEKAIDWIEIAVNCGYINYPFLNDYNPFLANIRGEPRFKKLMKRVKYEWEHFEV